MTDEERLEWLLLEAKKHRIGTWKHGHLRGRASRYAHRVDRKDALKVYWKLKMMPSPLLLWSHQ